MQAESTPTLLCRASFDSIWRGRLRQFISADAEHDFIQPFTMAIDPFAFGGVVRDTHVNSDEGPVRGS